jgi:hypothetical protein
MLATTVPARESSLVEIDIKDYYNHSRFLNFITNLPLSNSYDAVLVIVDRLTEMRHYVPCHMTDNAEDVSRIFTREIYRLYGALVSVISDRDIRFVNEF